MSSIVLPELQRELLDDFYAECEEHLRHIRDALISLEHSIGKAQADSKVIEELFRNFHSFKGISAIVGLSPAEELAHATEEFLRDLTQGKVSISAKGLDLLMAATQKLEQIVSAFRAQQPLPAHDALLRQIAGICEKKVIAQAAPVSSSVDAGHNIKIDEARSRGLLVWQCTFVPTKELDERGVNVTSVRAHLGKAGEILSAVPRVFGEGKIAFDFLVAMRETPADIMTWESDGVRVHLMDQDQAPLKTAGPGTKRMEGAEDNSPFIAPSHVVRVDLNRLDDLMRITGELVIQRSRFEDQISQSARRSVSMDVRTLQEVNLALGRSVKELREAIMRVRLVSVAEIFARMPFVVRDLARESSKKARIELKGQQTELDKYLIERLKDPLLHLVRNAFSHGIETAEERIAVGKPSEATILLSASARGDSVIIQVRDDGRGIDRNEVLKRAVSLGMQIPQTLDEAGLLRILCSPGFSTRDSADRASGRGVGMAVVNDTVRELGGSISLETENGRSTQFTLRLPLTLAIAETFIVSAAGQLCAIPQNFVTEVLQVTEEQIKIINQVEVVPYRSGVLPIIRLSSFFHLPGTARPRMTLLVLRSERGSSGLMVEQVHGQREVVVRAIRDPLVQVPGIVGATELGDGRPVLILDGAVLTSGPVRPHSTGELEQQLIRSAAHN
ncbi:MAG: CheA signal transduction histidine kinase [Verrucomicrobiales bacterium]|nr:CheA signal transduction histidine kinase [Verrucomicrobiales bacterium]